MRALIFWRRRLASKCDDDSQRAGFSHISGSTHRQPRRGRVLGFPRGYIAVFWGLEGGKSSSEGLLLRLDSSQRGSSGISSSSKMARDTTSKVQEEARTRGSSTSHGMFSRLNLTVECRTEFGQTVHVSGSSFLAGVSNPSLVSDLRRLLERGYLPYL